jgi:hypothetical protein
MIADHRLGGHAHLTGEAGNTGPRPMPGRNHRGALPITASPIDPHEHRSPARNPGEEMLTLQEACTFLRTPEGTLRYWRHLGSGPRSFKIGRQVRYWKPTSSSGSPNRPTAPSTTTDRRLCRRVEGG